VAQSQSVAKGADQGAPDGVPNQNFAALVIGSIGVVYGDIGTSPLYAFREAVHAAKATSFAGREAVFGVLSLITWALLLIASDLPLSEEDRTRLRWLVRALDADRERAA